jgi:carboxymethylenebutenolidase
MGKIITLTAGDGHAFSAYETIPAGATRGGLVVVQEIFGVNAHIRRVADGYAANGYRVIAPGIFDRAEPGIELGYDQADVERGMALRKGIPTPDMLADIAAAVAALQGAGKVGIVGYCLGGTLAWIAAARVPGLAAAVGYYGGAIAANLADTPKCPVLLHFGEADRGIPLADIEKIRMAAEPAGAQIFVYPGAGHAFNREGNQAWHGPSAKLARERTVAFLREQVG